MSVEANTWGVLQVTGQGEGQKGIGQAHSNKESKIRTGEDRALHQGMRNKKAAHSKNGQRRRKLIRTN